MVEELKRRSKIENSIKYRILVKYLKKQIEKDEMFISTKEIRELIELLEEVE